MSFLLTLFACLSVYLLHLWWRNMESEAFAASIMSSSCSPNSRLTQQQRWVTSISWTLCLFRKPHRLRRQPCTSAAPSTPAVGQHREGISTGTRLICGRSAPCCGNAVTQGAQNCSSSYRKYLTLHLTTQVSEKTHHQDHRAGSPKSTENFKPEITSFVWLLKSSEHLELCLWLSYNLVIFPIK